MIDHSMQGFVIIGASRLEDVRSARTREPSFVSPRHPIEQQLVQIWEQMLGVRPVGVTDNFFELGGTSILAASQGVRQALMGRAGSASRLPVPRHNSCPPRVATAKIPPADGARKEGA